MSEITLREALSVLSRSSPFAVSTVSQRTRDVFDNLKEYLFVEQEIEGDFTKILDSLQPSEIVFLCGSSGDGKSEILTRHYDKYSSRFHFHLDATHSFSPYQSAIQALDELFDKRKNDTMPMVVGINIGMLANFANEGAERHNDIKESVGRFLSGEIDLNQNPSRDALFYFLNFEHYPKFQFALNDRSYSSFAKALMKKLTSQTENNPFYRLAKSDEIARWDSKLAANFKLLSLESVQEVIITQLFKARLIKDQFVTTRALLDLLHYLLLGRGYLFDNLYVGEENELVKRISEFDPARAHTAELDQFVLRYELFLPDVELDEFIVELAARKIHFNRRDAKRGDAASLIRLFSILCNEQLGNNYHKKYCHQFEENLLQNYAEVWRLHKEYDGSTDMKIALRRFYTNEFIAAIQHYANRNAPDLSMLRDEIFLGAFGNVKLTAPVELKGDYEAILNNTFPNSVKFMAYLKVFDKTLEPISISLNLFELIYKLNRGYRPNKYDKNTIVLLEEIVEQVSELAKSSTSLKFYDGRRTYVAKQDDDMIAVSGAA